MGIRASIGWRPPSTANTFALLTWPTLAALLATGIGSDVQRPLAIVVIGRLVTSTLLTLLVAPALNK